MNPAHKQILREKSQYIINNVSLQEIKPLLLEYKVFNCKMWEDIHEVSDVFKLLPTRGPRAFQTIILILRRANYDEQADILENANRAEVDIAVEHLNTPLLRYNMLSEQSGYCLILNNEKFENFKERVGSGKNAEVLQNFFRSIKYDAYIKSNKKRDDMLNCVKKFSKRDFKSVDSAIVIIMSHGAMLNNKDIVFGTDGMKKDPNDNVPEDKNFIFKEKFIELFNNRNCEQLQGKPKVFIFISCRGDEKDDGVRRRLFPKESSDGGGESKPTMPTYTDILIVHSTMPHAFSICDDNGSYFCQDLVSVLQENCYIFDLITIIRLVNRKLLERPVSPMFGVIQPAEFEEYAFKSLYFKPPSI